MVAIDAISASERDKSIWRYRQSGKSSQQISMVMGGLTKEGVRLIIQQGIKLGIEGLERKFKQFSCAQCGSAYRISKFKQKACSIECSRALRKKTMTTVVAERGPLIYAMRLASISWKEIAAHFGTKHSTVMQQVRAWAAAMQIDISMIFTRTNPKAKAKPKIKIKPRKRSPHRGDQFFQRAIELRRARKFWSEIAVELEILVPDLISSLHTWAKKRGHDITDCFVGRGFRKREGVPELAGV